MAKAGSLFCVSVSWVMPELPLPPLLPLQPSLPWTPLPQRHHFSPGHLCTCPHSHVSCPLPTLLPEGKLQAGCSLETAMEREQEINYSVYT